MRRGINIRKKKRIALNKSNKKSLKILSLLITILFICFVIYFSFIQDIFIQKNFEKDSIDFSTLNENIPFSLDRIILFSSATAVPDSVNQHLSLDISNYCDIGIYLNNSDIDYDVIIDKEKIRIDSSLKIDSLISNVLGVSEYEIKSSYVGYFNDERIERVE